MTATARASRRTRIGLPAIGLLAVTSMFVACAPVAEESPSPNPGNTPEQNRSVTFVSTGGTASETIGEAVLKPFEEATGIKVNIDPSGTTAAAKLQPMVDSGNVEWDVIMVFTSTTAELLRLNLLQEIDYSRLEIGELVDDSLKTPYTIGYNTFAHNVWWNADQVDGEFTSWVDVFDTEKYPGQRGFSENPSYTVEAALLGDGVAPEDLYPLDLDRAYAMLEKIRNDSVFLGAEPLTNQIASGNLISGDINQNRLLSAMAAGVNIKFTWNQSLVDTTSLAIPKDAPNYDEALELIQYFMLPATQLRLLQVLTTNGPTLVEAYDELDDETIANLSGSPVNAPKAVFLNAEWYARYGVELQERHAEFLRG